MSKPWPVERFNERLQALMKAADIPDRAELSRLSGVDQTQLSNWRHGKTSPSRQSLRKIAKVLGVPPVALYVEAGIDSPEDLDLSEAPKLAAMPTELRELVAIYDDTRLTDDDRRVLRQSVRLFLAGFMAGINEREAKAKAAKRPPRGRSAA